VIAVGRDPGERRRERLDLADERWRAIGGGERHEGR